MTDLLTMLAMQNQIDSALVKRDLWMKQCIAAETEVYRLREAHEDDRHEIGKLHSVRDRLGTRIAELENGIRGMLQYLEGEYKYGGFADNVLQAFLKLRELMEKK